MRVLALCLLLAATPLVSAADQAPRPPQAPPLRPVDTPTRVASAPCLCPFGGPCTCVGGCTCRSDQAQRVRPLTYADARPRAVREALPLVVWVGTSCPKCERELRDCLHVHVSTFPGCTGPCVVVGVPRDGELWRTDLAGQPSVEQIRNVIRGATAARPVAEGIGSVGYAAPVYQPVFTGGFGGGVACRT